MLKELTNKIKKIIPEIEEWHSGDNEADYQSPRDITLEDVLRCLEESVDWVKYGFISVDTKGNFWASKPDCEDKLDIKWLLGKPLYEQSEETIKKLNKLI